MSTVESDVNVRVPISVAYNVWTQFESFPTFMDSVKEITQTSDTELHWRVKVAGVEREFDAVITELIPDERVSWKSVDGSTHAGVVTFHRLSEDETRVSVRIDWAPDGFVEKAGALLQADDIAIDRDLRSFKDMIEAQDLETDGWLDQLGFPGGNAPENLAEYDAADGNEALPDFDEGEHGARGADGPDDDAINISESDGPDLHRDH